MLYLGGVSDLLRGLSRQAAFATSTCLESAVCFAPALSGRMKGRLGQGQAFQVSKE